MARPLVIRLDEALAHYRRSLVTRRNPERRRMGQRVKAFQEVRRLIAGRDYRALAEQMAREGVDPDIAKVIAAQTLRFADTASEMQAIYSAFRALEKFIAGARRVARTQAEGGPPPNWANRADIGG